MLKLDKNNYINHEKPVNSAMLRFFPHDFEWKWVQISTLQKGTSSASVQAGYQAVVYNDVSG